MRTRSGAVIRPARYSRGPARTPYVPSAGVRAAGRVARAAGNFVRGAARFAGPVGMGLAVADAVNQVAQATAGASRPNRRSRGTSTGAWSVGNGGKRTRSFTRGRYVGRFKRTRKVKKNMYLMRGFVHTHEVHGTVSDPDCVYIGHSTLGARQLMELVQHVLLKKLFQKTGFYCRNIREPIPGYEANTSNCWRIILYRNNKSTGVTDSTTYTTPNGLDVSIYQIVGDVSTGLAPLWSGLGDFLTAYATGQFGTGTGENLNVLQPTKLRLFRAEDNVASFWQFQNEINLENEVIYLKTISELKVQNRTLSATGDDDAEDVTNNPIEGKLYHFNQGCPRSKIPGVNLVESMLEPNGVLTARAAQLTTVPGFKEPPPAQSFWNCSGSRKVMINPGDIKKDVIKFFKRLPFLTFIRHAGVGFGPSPTRQISLFGKSAVLALEDMINVNPTHNISIAYEINREFGMYMMAKNKNISIGERYSTEVDNNPVL